MITPSTTTGTLGVLNAAVDINLSGSDTFAFQVSGTWVGTISFSGSLDGTNYIPFGVHTLVRANNYDQQATTTINGIFVHETHSVNFLRIQMTSYTSGTATVVIQGDRQAK
jgi:hypothetical protein